MAQTDAANSDAQNKTETPTFPGGAGAHDSIHVVVQTDGDLVEAFGPSEEDREKARTRATNLTESQHISGTYEVVTDDGHNDRLLPVTACGRRKKAEREGWSMLGTYKATFPSRQQVNFHKPGDDSRQPRKLRVRYVPKCLHWRCETTVKEFDENQSELARGSFAECLDAAKSFLVPDQTE